MLKFLLSFLYKPSAFASQLLLLEKSKKKKLFGILFGIYCFFSIFSYIGGLSMFEILFDWGSVFFLSLLVLKLEQHFFPMPDDKKSRVSYLDNLLILIILRFFLIAILLIPSFFITSEEILNGLMIWVGLFLIILETKVYAYILETTSWKVFLRIMIVIMGASQSLDGAVSWLLSVL